MVSRPLVFSVLGAMAASAATASASASTPRHLRRATATDGGSGSSEDVPDVLEGRRLDDVVRRDDGQDVPPVRDSRRAEESRALSSDESDEVVPFDEPSDEEVMDDEDFVLRTSHGRTLRADISRKCYVTMKASATNGRLRRSNYFVFTDGMSNGYFTFNNVTDYSGLPYPNKFGFVTLSCQCTAFGGSGNCCQGQRAMIDVQGIEDRRNIYRDEGLRMYVADVCAVTVDAIGEEQMLPETGEMPGLTNFPTFSLAPSASKAPSSGPSASKAPSSVPSASTWPTISSVPTGSPRPSTMPAMFPTTPLVPVEESPGVGTPSPGTRPEGGLSTAGIAGIAVASGVVLFFLLVLMKPNRRKRDDDDVSDDDVSEMSAQNVVKERLAITANGEDGEGGACEAELPRAPDSPDATNSMTASDVSSIPSMGASNGGDSGGAPGTTAYYANNSLLPGRPDEESMLSSSDGPSFFTDDAGREEEKQSLSSNSMDQAIESGNWEAVAASAAAIVKQSETSSPGVHTGVEV
ncbi:hypothetical protein ACHAWF_015025 [Thalassiosira exigua]